MEQTSSGRGSEVAAFTRLIDLVRQLTTDTATVDRTDADIHGIQFADVQPRNPHAVTVSLIAEQWLIIQLGDPGGRWELDYDDQSLALAESLVRAAIAGRVVQRSACGRSTVEVTLADGVVMQETGYRGCLPLLLPLPGWRTWGKGTHYEAYT
ncbi:hypothetical protein [Microbacterium sp. PRC9]|uniref:hypothetical protein n=1 Tax=Microbacterium sp. PRC9 TaxID=2962591 RepID=UPI0028813335|nr:hypothetical protein [Microbacterium sp. PRC9]MDT0143675.1 hypothetical protein [Microbacterium sp. PRC9]